MNDKARFAALMWDFYRCPTTSRVLEALKGDDKVLCGCGRSNPRVPEEQTHRTGTHIVRFLQRATADEYVAERQIVGHASPCRSQRAVS